MHGAIVPPTPTTTHGAITHLMYCLEIYRASGQSPVACIPHSAHQLLRHHAGPSLRLCSCRPQIAVFANSVMFLRSNEEVVTVYVLNYALLLVWGVSSVMVEATVGAEERFTSYFSAFFALAIGLLCSVVHIICPFIRRRHVRRAEAAVVRYLCMPLLSWSSHRNAFATRHSVAMRTRKSRDRTRFLLDTQ